MTLILVLVSVALSSVAQLLLRLGMSAPTVRQALGTHDALLAVRVIASSPNVLGGLALYVVSALTWLLVLARLPLSLAYPFVAIGLVTTVLMGRFLLGESMSYVQVIGTGLIVVGIFILAWGAYLAR